MPSFQASPPGQARSDVTYPCSRPHDGTRYQAGDTFEGDAAVVKRLIKAGALRDKDAIEETSEADAQGLIADANARAAQIVDEAKERAEAIAKEIVDKATVEAEAIKADAQKVADDTKKAASDLPEQIKADAKKASEAKK
ncbi:hypothetical protein GCM10010922_02850 [Microbacterium sorbitolivorans]|uniref:Uncharacterized protein n=1 Tax=Microbacterium sorbitolivorans TaxID=1867410 RepID=A0A367Y7D1_9MICO|nr:hypothetical protein DTO57_02625 [Microbacterium sorbitolivorans]GGF31235.1 hypothetical protein GCM10010922_02850 [Microbacterium sorbitolivorans]